MYSLMITWEIGPNKMSAVLLDQWVCWHLICINFWSKYLTVSHFNNKLLSTFSTHKRVTVSASVSWLYYVVPIIRRSLVQHYSLACPNGSTINNARFMQWAKKHFGDWMNVFDGAVSRNPNRYLHSPIVYTGNTAVIKNHQLKYVLVLNWPTRWMLSLV